MGFGYAVFLQAAIGMVLLSAAAAKLSRQDSLHPFLLAMGFSPWTSKQISHTAPWLEGLVGILLLSGTAFPAAAAAAVLSLAFCAILVLAKLRGVVEGCRCFGALDSSQFSFLPIVRATILAAVALLLGLTYLQAGLAEWSGLWQGFSAILAILGVFAGIGYVVAFAVLEQVWHFEKRRPRRRSDPKDGGVVENKVRGATGT